MRRNEGQSHLLVHSQTVRLLPTTHTPNVVLEILKQKNSKKKGVGSTEIAIPFLGKLKLPGVYNQSWKGQEREAGTVFHLRHKAAAELDSYFDLLSATCFRRSSPMVTGFSVLTCSSKMPSNPDRGQPQHTHLSFS